MSKKISRPTHFNQYAYVDKEGRHVCVVTTRYHDKLVRGVAVCAPSDKYNEDVGMCLAQRRCEAKYYKAKLNSAMHKVSRLAEATEAILQQAHSLIEQRKEAFEYAKDSADQLEEAERLIEDMLKEVNAK